MSKRWVTAALAEVLAVALCSTAAVCAPDPAAAGAAGPGDPAAAGPKAKFGAGMMAEPWRKELRELPAMLMMGATAPWAKNNPEVQALVDKAIADMTVMQQDEQARLAAFQAVVQAERAADPKAIQAARDGLKAAAAKLHADAQQLYKDDLEPLDKKIREIAPDGAIKGPKGNPETPAAKPDATKGGLKNF